MAYNPALIVVDMQNDFCPPDGSLAVTGGRDIIPLINNLISCPAFTFRVATKDYHPTNHISFASNHEPPDNKPFESYVEISNLVAGKPEEKFRQRLWPVHCVQGSRGGEHVAGLDTTNFNVTILKGSDHRVEMYSAFTDAFGNMTAGAGGVNHDLAAILRDKEITHTYVVGLAGDYCVKDTAIGSARAGFVTIVIEEGQRCVDPGAWATVKQELTSNSVKVVGLDSDEVRRLGSELSASVLSNERH